MIIAAIMIAAIFFLFWENLKTYEAKEEQKLFDNKDYIPEASLGVIYHKPHYSLSYVERYEIPEWVTYRLTKDMMNSPKQVRDQEFNSDPYIAEESAHYHDYKGSGYSRGHLVPAADMSWNREAMDATFLLSNIAPMRKEFNDGIWLELEHNVRDWSRKYDNIIVITGPVFRDSLGVIGRNDVFVPRYFYKAVYKIEKATPDAIGFLFDQTMITSQRLESFIVPIDSIEKLTGLDLFANLYGDWDEEIRLEKQKERTPGHWPFNEKWYAERMKNAQ